MKEPETFDSRIKAILESGEEEVPAGLWDAIQEKLPAKRRFRPVWWQYAAAGLAAAAAAVLIAVVPRRHTDNLIQISPVPGTTVETVADAIVPGETPLVMMHSETKPQAVTQTDFSQKDDVTGETVIEDKGTEEPAESEVDKSSSAMVSNKADESSEKWVDEFALMEAEDAAQNRRPKVSLTASCNATSNNNPTTTVSGTYSRSYAQGSSNPSSDRVVETGNSRYDIPVSFGIGAKIVLTERFSLGTGINFTSLNRSFAGNYTRVDANGDIIDKNVYSDIRNRQQYIGIPVNVYYSFTQMSAVDMYAYAGGCLEKCLSNKFFMSGNSGDFTMSNTARGLQASVNAGIGVEFIAFRNLGFYFDPSIRYYFDCKQPESIRTNQPLMMGFEVGARLRLK